MNLMTIMRPSNFAIVENIVECVIQFFRFDQLSIYINCIVAHNHQIFKTCFKVFSCFDQQESSYKNYFVAARMDTNLDAKNPLIIMSRCLKFLHPNYPHPHVFKFQI